MEQQQQSRWRPTRRQVLWASTAVALLIVAILIGYRYGITLWDWIELLIVPAVIAGGGLWFNAQQREREQQIADDRAQDEALQAYLDQISQLLTDKERPLHRSQRGDPPSTVARARTLTVLPSLDGARKAHVVQFLYEAGLIAKDRTIVDLSGANLRGASLVQAGLSEANLSGADLRRADLRSVNLSGADLRRADLRRADLSQIIERYKVHSRGGVNKFFGGGGVVAEVFEGEATVLSPPANLSGADLRGADFREADLREADLEGARGVTEATLFGRVVVYEDYEERALRHRKSFQGATMPDGQKLKGSSNPSGPSVEDWFYEQTIKNPKSNLNLSGPAVEEWLKKEKEGRGEDGENSGPS